MNLINKAQKLKIINALLIAIIFGNICNNAHFFEPISLFFGGIIVLFCSAFLVNAAHMPRSILVSIAFFMLSLYWFKPNIF